MAYAHLGHQDLSWPWGHNSFAVSILPPRVSLCLCSGVQEALHHLTPHHHLPILSLPGLEPRAQFYSNLIFCLQCTQQVFPVIAPVQRHLKSHTSYTIFKSFKRKLIPSHWGLLWPKMNHYPHPKKLMCRSPDTHSPRYCYIYFLGNWDS